MKGFVALIDFTNDQNTSRGVIWDYIYTSEQTGALFDDRFVGFLSQRDNENCRVSDIKMLFFGLSFILYVLQLPGRNVFLKDTLSLF